MKTQLVITINHPEGTTASDLIQMCITDELEFVNGMLADGWSLTWEQKETTEKETTMETSYEELKAKTANLYNNYQSALLSSVLKTIDMISNLDEDAGYVILAKLRQHFHMEGNLYGRGDFEAVLGRKLSGQEWEMIYSSQSFYNNLGEDDNLYVVAIQHILDEVGIGG